MIALLKRYATAKLRRENDRLTADLEAERRRLAVVEAERDSMAAVIARDRERIWAEGAAYIRQRAEAEGMTDAKRPE